MIEEKEKIPYSRNEKIVRFICFAGIFISIIVGILLFPIGKPSGGIIVLSTSAVSFILMLPFVSRTFKDKFKCHKYRRFIYASFYAAIIILSMLTAVIVSYFTSYPIEDMASSSLDFVSESVSREGSIRNIETEIFDWFEGSDSYYFAIEVNYEKTNMGGAISIHSKTFYIKANKYTSVISSVSFLEYEVARSYVN